MLKLINQLPERSGIICQFEIQKIGVFVIVLLDRKSSFLFGIPKDRCFRNRWCSFVAVTMFSFRFKCFLVGTNVDVRWECSFRNSNNRCPKVRFGIQKISVFWEKSAFLESSCVPSRDVVGFIVVSNVYRNRLSPNGDVCDDLFL